MLRTMLATMAILALVAAANAETVLQVDYSCWADNNYFEPPPNPLAERMQPGWSAGGNQKYWSAIGVGWDINGTFDNPYIPSPFTLTVSNPGGWMAGTSVPDTPAVSLGRVYQDGIKMGEWGGPKYVTQTITGLAASTQFSMTVYAWGFGCGDVTSTWTDVTGGASIALGTIQSHDAPPTTDATYALTFMTTSDATGTIVIASDAPGQYYINGFQIATAVSDTPVWNKNGSGDWNVTGNWMGGVPNGNTKMVTFGNIITSPRTVFTDAAVTVKSITFDNANKYVIAGAGSLTFAADGGNAAITVLQGNHVFQLPVILAVDGTDVSVAGGATLTFDGALDLAGYTMTKTGSGTMFINNKLNLGTGGQILVNEGSVELCGQLVLALSSIPTAPLTLLDVGGGSVGGTFYGLPQNAEVDLPFGGTTYKFTISYTGGTGNDVVLNLIPAHIPGDINDDNIVDQADYTVWYNHYGQTPATWADGDVTGDSIVDQADYTVWYNNYGSTGGNVPEPKTMALLAIGGLAMLRRR